MSLDIRVILYTPRRDGTMYLGKRISLWRQFEELHYGNSRQTSERVCGTPTLYLVLSAVTHGEELAHVTVKRTGNNNQVTSAQSC